MAADISSETALVAVAGTVGENEVSSLGDDAASCRSLWSTRCTVAASTCSVRVVETSKSSRHRCRCCGWSPASEVRDAPRTTRQPSSRLGEPGCGGDSALLVRPRRHCPPVVRRGPCTVGPRREAADLPPAAAAGAVRRGQRAADHQTGVRVDHHVGFEAVLAAGHRLAGAAGWVHRAGGYRKPTRFEPGPGGRPGVR